MKEKKFIKKQILYMNMSGVYDEMSPQENFKDLLGTNGYCDDAAAETIRRRLADYDYEGIHFLDSGNYHYLSYFWLEKIPCDFSLVLIDHHPDLKKPGFGDILSCGGWVQNALDDLPRLKMVYLVDVDPTLIKELGVLPPRVIRMDKQEALKGDFGALPLYLSVDKDVLSETEVMTDWDQGDMTCSQLLKIMETIAKNTLLGLDICGEIKDNKGTEVQERQRLLNRRILDRFCD